MKSHANPSSCGKCQSQHNRVDVIVTYHADRMNVGCVFSELSQTRTQTSSHPSASIGQSISQSRHAWKYFWVIFSRGHSYQTLPPSGLNSTRTGQPLPLYAQPRNLMCPSCTICAFVTGDMMADETGIVWIGKPLLYIAFCFPICAV